MSALNNKASRELDELLCPFYQECEGDPLEAIKPEEVSWWYFPLIVLGLIAWAAAIGCLCAWVVRL